jgi:hypothetical protein
MSRKRKPRSPVAAGAGAIGLASYDDDNIIQTDLSPQA